MMHRLVFCLLATLAAGSAAALPSDLAVTTQAAATTLPGATYTLTGTVVNNGPGTADSVRISMGIGGLLTCHDDTDIGALAVGQQKSFTCSGTVPQQPPGYQLSTWFSAWTEDELNSADNNANGVVLVMTPPDLRAWGYAFTPVAPGLPATMHVYYFNDANTAADPATVTLTTAGTFLTVPPFCTAEGGTARCDVAPLARTEAGEAPYFEVTVQAPDASAVDFDLAIEIGPVATDFRPDNNVYTVPARTFRTFFVTNTANDGSGSLRAAIDAANAACTDSWPCLVAFRIQDSGTPWHTIAVTAPLPAIIQPLVTIDATTQTAYFGDANPAGPEVELSGTGPVAGSGIEIVRGCASAVRGLAINGFPAVGVRVGSGTGCVHFGYPNQPFAHQRAVERNYIGTDPTGTLARPNGLGVYVDGTEGTWAVVANVISGNRRSGVHAGGGKNVIAGNIIGLTAGPTAGLGNEASGVYVGPRADGTDVIDNHIGFNHHFGVAIDAEADNVAILGNSFQANWQLAIDRGLDGVTPTGVPLPEIVDARFDGGATVIEIEPGPVGGTFEPRVQVYASDAQDPSGYGEGQYYLGEAHRTAQDSRRYSLRIEQDLTGLWVAATNTRVVYNGWLTTAGVKSEGDTGWGHTTTTSEFGRAVQVR